MDINVYEQSSKIVIITAGGTIGQKKNQDGVKEPFEGVIEKVSRNAIARIESETPICFSGNRISFDIKPLFLIDSVNITPERRNNLAASIYETSLVPGIVSIIVTTGTDTLKETINTMPIMLETKLPVIFVVSNKSPDEGIEAQTNMEKALIASVTLSQSCIGGIFLVATSNKIYEAANVTEINGSFGAVKRPSEVKHLGVFEDYILRLDEKKKDTYTENTSRITGSLLNLGHDENVIPLTISAGTSFSTNERLIKAAAEMASAIVLETNHSLSVGENLHGVLKEAARKIPVFVTSPFPVFVNNVGSYVTSRSLYDIGVYPGTGQPRLDLAIARAAVASGVDPKLSFMDGVLRASMGGINFHREVTARDLENLAGMRFHHAISQASAMNQRLNDTQNSLRARGLLRQTVTSSSNLVKVRK